MNVLRTKKRGSTVWLVCKAHEAAGLRRPFIRVVSIKPVRANRVRALFTALRNLVVAGSNPASASTLLRRAYMTRRNVILAVYWRKNQRNNVEKTSCFLKPFLKINPNLPRLAPLRIRPIYHRLAAFIVRARECTLLHGVDILS